MVNIYGVIKEYSLYKNNSVKALNGVSFELPATGIVAIVGKSGCGKSTLLNLLGGLDKPTQGKIIIDVFLSEEQFCISDADEKKLDFFRSTYMGFVFQDFNLVDEWNVYDNIAITLEQQGLPKEKTEQRVREVLDFVGLNGLENRRTNELSGGQIQRVSIARAIAKYPKLILADEPTGNLDTENSKIVMELLKKSSANCLVVVVTHDLEDAEKYADRIIRLSDGVIIEDYNTEKTVASFEKEEIKKTQNPQNALAFSTIFRLAYENLLKKRAKIIFSIFAYVILISLLFFCADVLLCRTEAKEAKYLTNADLSFLYFANSLYLKEVPNGPKFLETIQSNFGSENCTGLIMDVYAVNPSNPESEYDCFIAVGGQPDYHYVISGNLPKRNNEAVISDFLCKSLKLEEPIIGQTINLFGVPVKICGITNTKITAETIQDLQQELYGDVFRIINRVIVSADFPEYLAETKDTIELKAAVPYKIRFEETAYQKVTYAPVSRLKQENAFFFYGDYCNEDTEIVISDAFGSNNFITDFSGIPHKVNYAFTDIYEARFKGRFDGYLNMFDYVCDVDITGVIWSEEAADIYISDSLYEAVKRDYYKNYLFDQYEVVIPEGYVFSKTQVKDIEEKADLEVNEIDGFETSLENIREYRIVSESAVFFICALLLLFLVLFFSLNIRDNQKKIGIMRALGITEKDITKLFLVEMSVIYVISVVLSLIFSSGVFEIINYTLKEKNISRSEVLPLSINGWAILVCMFIVLLLFGLSVISPILALAKYRPMLLIKEKREKNN